MRRLALPALLLAAPLAQAQTTLGVRVGAAAAAFTPQLFTDGATRAAPSASAFAEIPLSTHVSARPELFYSAEGSRITPSSLDVGDGDVRSVSGGIYTDYVGLGVFAASEVLVRGVRLGGYAGPAIAVKLRERSLSRVDGGEAFANPSSLFNRVQSSGVVGATARMGPFGLDARLAVSLEDVRGASAVTRRTTVRSRVASLGISYGLGL